MTPGDHAGPGGDARAVLDEVFRAEHGALVGGLVRRFRDVERPKYRLFELHDEIERGGELKTEGNRG